MNDLFDETKNENGQGGSPNPPERPNSLRRRAVKSISFKKENAKAEKPAASFVPEPVEPVAPAEPDLTLLNEAKRSYKEEELPFDPDKAPLFENAPEAKAVPESETNENEAGEGEPEEKKKPEKLPLPITVFDWAKTFLISLVTVIFIFTLFFRGVTVEGDSMNHTLSNKDYLIVSDLFYTPKTGDIIVFQSQNYHNGEESLVKRVIATGGQTVRIDFNKWEVYVDGVLLDEPYINKVANTTMFRGDKITPDGIWEETVEEGYLFVMGDNRNNSLDSRSNGVGLVDEHYVMGRVILRVFPFQSIGLFF